MSRFYWIGWALAVLAAGLMGAQVGYAQEDMGVAAGYRVCDWGTVVFTPGLHSPQQAVETTPEPDPTPEATPETEAAHLVTITSPFPNAGVAVSGFKVTGTGKGLFENNVVVEVLDAEGKVIFISATTMQTEEVGGAGEWSLDISLDNPDIRAGSVVSIRAYSESPADGSVWAEDMVDVVSSPMAAVWDTVLYIAQDDPLGELPAGEFCAAAEQQATYPGYVAVEVTEVRAIATRSIPPQVHVTITAELPLDCPFPLRAFKTQDGGAIEIHLFYFMPADAGCGGEKVEIYVGLPLGAISEAGFTITVNGMTMS